MSPNLARRGEKAKAHHKLVFTSLYHHIADIEHLRACYQLLKGNKAVGVDEVTKAMYAADLEANLQDLSARLKRMGYQQNLQSSRQNSRPSQQIDRSYLSLGSQPLRLKLSRCCLSSPAQAQDLHSQAGQRDGAPAGDQQLRRQDRGTRYQAGARITLRAAVRGV